MTVGNVNSSVNGIQASRAQQAFENLKKISQKYEITQKKLLENVENQTVSLNSKIQNRMEEPVNDTSFGINEKYMEEIKSFIGKNNIQDVEDEDIKYALRYGTSILADYKA